MSKVKKRWITLISLISALFLLLGFVIGLPRISAYANEYAPGSVFSQGSGGTVGASDKGEDGKAYVQFTFSDGGNVHFRRDLALKWYAEVEKLKENAVDEKDTEKKVEVQYFSMQFAFAEVNFEKFTISFESAEENISKDGKRTNTIVFEPVAKQSETPETPEEEPAAAAEDETQKGEEKTPQLLNVYINPEEKDEAETVEDAVPVKVDAGMDILITLDEKDCEIGEFNVRVKNVKEAAPQTPNEGGNSEASGAALEEELAPLAGKFTNVGGYFLDYRSASSSTPNTPITFTAKFSAAADAKLRQQVLMKSLNQQSMLLNSSDRVVDDTPAVLVLNEEIYAFKLGQKFSLSYEAIDVCDDNVTVSREYYMLKTVDDVPYMPNEQEMKDTDEVKYSQYNYKNLTTYTYFLPSQNFVPTPEKPDPEEYVSIRFKLNDDTADNDTYVLLSWYANADAKATFNCTGYEEYTNKDNMKDVRPFEEKRDFDFIKVSRKSEGPYYNYLEAKAAEDPKTEENKNVVTDSEKFQEAVNAYRSELEEKAENTSAGTGAYIYLPSLRGLIKSNNAGYRNLKFSIYYYKPGSSSASSQTSLNYNALKLEVDKEGDYRFRVIAQDNSSNAMQYYLEGELVTVTSSNVWDIEGIPEFEFHIHYDGPTIEKTEEQKLGYRNDTYSFADFDIVALSGYQKNYTLYRYAEVNVPENMSVPTSYSDFVENADTYFKAFTELDNAKEDKTQKILYEISVFQDDVSADDEAKWNRTDNDYYWDPDSSLSFVPQEAGYYILKLVVEDGSYPGETAEAFQVIEVRNPIDTIPAQSQWLQENVISVILFAISGVLAIVVVVLFLIKPSDKKVEEVDLDKLKGKKNKK